MTLVSLLAVNVSMLTGLPPPRQSQPRPDRRFNNWPADFTPEPPIRNVFTPFTDNEAHELISRLNAPSPNGSILDELIHESARLCQEDADSNLMIFRDRSRTFVGKLTDYGLDFGPPVQVALTSRDVTDLNNAINTIHGYLSAEVADIDKLATAVMEAHDSRNPMPLRTLALLLTDQTVLDSRLQVINHLRQNFPTEMLWRSGIPTENLVGECVSLIGQLEVDRLLQQ